MKQGRTLLFFRSTSKYLLYFSLVLIGLNTHSGTNHHVVRVKPNEWLLSIQDQPVVGGRATWLIGGRWQN